MEIPFFNYPRLYQQRKKEYQTTLNDVLSRGAYIMQKDLIDFEDSLSNYLDVKNVIGVADGTMALLTSLMASGIGEGDEVIVPSHTFIASAAAIHHVGATPILADCGSDHLLNIDSVIERYTENTRAIMPVQLNGRVCEMDKIMDFARTKNLKVIEDSCQAVGAKFKGKFAGTFGDAGTCSFFPAKTLGCFGDGGAVLTNDNDLADRVRTLRDHGRDPIDGKVKVFGFNSRLDNIQAAILNVKLKYYNEDLNKRRELASIYNDKLKDVSEIKLPPPPEDGDNYDIFQNYEIEANNRHDLREYLADAGIGTILQWGGYMVHQFEDLKLNSNVPHTEQISNDFMLLPMHHMLTKEEIHYISDRIISFYK